MRITEYLKQLRLSKEMKKNKINNQSGFVLINFIAGLAFLIIAIYAAGLIFDISILQTKIFKYILYGSVAIVVLVVMNAMKHY